MYPPKETFAKLNSGFTSATWIFPIRTNNKVIDNNESIIDF